MQRFFQKLCQIGVVFLTTGGLIAAPAAACSMKINDTRTCVGRDCADPSVVPPDDASIAETGYLRLATFNIRIFSKGSRDADEVAAIANVLRMFDLVAIQELRDTEVLTRTITVLERKTGVDWDFVASGPVGNGVKERYAYLYRTLRVKPEGAARLIDNVWRKSPPTPNDSYAGKIAQLEGKMRGKNVKPFLREPFLGSFRAGKFDFRLLTIHTIYKKKESLQRGVEFRQLAAVYTELLDDGGDKDLIVLGDFNDPPDHKRFKPLAAISDLRCFTNPPQKTTIRDISLYDTICFQRSNTEKFVVNPSGNAEVIVFEDQNPYAKIPVSKGRYKKACLEVSDHRPVHILFRTK